MNITKEIVEEVIHKKDINIFFQPIYSLNTQNVIGIEALARCIYNDKELSPYMLFEYSRKTGSTLELDRLCREKAMKEFSEAKTAPVLYINFDTSVLNSAKPVSGEILKSAERYGIDPSNIVIEVNESKVRDAYNLLMFVDYYRTKGFLIALDNISSGEDTLNRIMLVNPDIIKIDKAIISNIDTNTYNQEILKSVISIAKKMGSLTVAEGVETAEEILTCVVLGIDYFQGYYFSKPEHFNYLFTNEARLKLEQSAQKLNLSIKNNPTVKNVKLESYRRIIVELVNRLEETSPDEYNEELLSYVAEHKEIECAFVINSDGYQITNTVMLNGNNVNPGYFPAICGDNHGIKNYFYAVKESIEDPFISGWYESSATGNMCKTISSGFMNKDGKLLVACVDLKK